VSATQDWPVAEQVGPEPLSPHRPLESTGFALLQVSPRQQSVVSEQIPSARMHAATQTCAVGSQPPPPAAEQQSASAAHATPLSLHTLQTPLWHVPTQQFELMEQACPMVFVQPAGGETDAVHAQPTSVPSQRQLAPVQQGSAGG